MRLTADQVAVLETTIKQLKQTIAYLEFVKQEPDVPEEAQDAIIGDTTRKAIDRLNVVRDEWGFDAIEREEQAT